MAVRRSARMKLNGQSVAVVTNGPNGGRIHFLHLRFEIHLSSYEGRPGSATSMVFALSLARENVALRLLLARST
jgi:hypothetical protein